MPFIYTTSTSYNVLHTVQVNIFLWGVGLGIGHGLYGCDCEEESVWPWLMVKLSLRPTSLKIN